jgi:hypothetical protein
MAIIRTTAGRLVRGLALAATLVLAVPRVAAAQSPSPEAGADVFGNMPGVVILIIPVAIGAALYLSYRLGRGDEEVGPKREGAVSRALARKGDS